MARKRKLYNLALPRYPEKNRINFVFSCYESKKITMKKIGLAMIFWKTVKYDSMYLVACNINANEKMHFLNN